MVWRVGWLVPMVWRVGWLVPMVWRVGWLVPMVWLVGVWCRWCGWLVFIHGGVCLVCVDDLSELLLGEAKLQQYLKENPIKQGSSPRGQRPRLAEVRKHLTAALERGNLKPDYQQEATLLMGKLCYVEGDYREALNHYSRVNLDEMQLVGAPVYRLSMIAEAYATRGQYRAPLQPARTSASTQGAERNQLLQCREILTCYEKSGDIALLYLQEVEKLCCSKIPERFINMEIFVFCSNLTRGVGRFREILRAVETRTTQNLRMTIARQLAEILLRGMCEQSYWSPLEDPPPQSPLDDPHCPTRSSRDYALSRRPRVYSGENLFCPQENTEEALLLLLISESMANRDAVLSRIPEHNADRVISLQSASVVYDLLTIALGRRGQYEMLSECLERAMKFAFEEFHLWYQLALSLMAAGKSARAVKVLKECIRLKPDDATIPLLAVKLCIGNLHWLEEGERFAKMVVDMEDKAPEFRAKGHLALGLVYSLKATDGEWAQSLSPTDHLAAFYLALQLAVSRQIPEALGYVRQALQLQGDDVHSLHLLALLLSAQKHYHDALNIIEMALSEYPENFMLLFTKVKLETLCRGPEEALLTCKHMLQIWKSCYNLTNPSDSGRGSSLLDRAIADRRQLNTMTLPDFSDPETGSVHATSIAASRVEQALSEVASSLQSSAPKQGPLHPWMTLAQIWLHAAEVYIGMLKPAEALACTLEAASLFPLSHNVLFMKGQVAELRGNTEEAKRWYEEALSISPTHVKSMQRLVRHTHTHSQTDHRDLSAVKPHEDQSRFSQLM
uniref:Tetratricopeptide repeat protein 7 N-terminal domain-containing protein n=1 Tax=Pygocentrus nattereri TaxID=42514 RepID=A0AAR2IQ70_PYGNA